MHTDETTDCKIVDNTNAKVEFFQLVVEEPVENPSAAPVVRPTVASPAPSSSTLPPTQEQTVDPPAEDPVAAPVARPAEDPVAAPVSRPAVASPAPSSSTLPPTQEQTVDPPFSAYTEEMNMKFASTCASKYGLGDTACKTNLIGESQCDAVASCNSFVRNNVDGKCYRFNTPATDLGACKEASPVSTEKHT